MLLNLEQLQEIEATTIWLETTPEEIEISQPNAQIYSNQTGLSNAVLNQLCLTKFQLWLEKQGIPHTLSFSAEELVHIWDVVTGCAIEIDKTRLILLPTDNLDREVLIVPQEWVDLPSFYGDYYLGVQVDLDAGVMNIWGFASHRQVKEQGQYDARKRSYSLDSDFLVSDFNILQMAQDLGLYERAVITELPELALEEGLALIQKLSVVSPYSPRTKLPFLQWGGILNRPNLRAQLYQTRLQMAIIDRVQKPKFRLWDWCQGQFAEAIASGWQEYQPVVGVSRAEIAPMSKLIDLQVDLQQETVMLLVVVVPEDSDRMRISVQVHPSGQNIFLPPQLQLSYVDEHGASLRTVTARSNDNCIQLPPYTCPIGMKFNIQLQLQNTRIIERLVA